MPPARSGTSNNPPTPVEIPEEADALLRCVYLYLGNPLRLDFVGWLRGHGFRFIASPPADHNGEKTVTARAPSGETYTVGVSVDPKLVAQACQAIRRKRDEWDSAPIGSARTIDAQTGEVRIHPPARPVTPAEFMGRTGSVAETETLNG